MYQIVGRIVCNLCDIGVMLFDYGTKELIRVGINDEDNGLPDNIINLLKGSKEYYLYSGLFHKLPEYDINGRPSNKNRPVITEIFKYNDETVGYAVVDKEGYKALKTEDLIKNYKSLFNAKIRFYKKSGKTVVATNGCGIKITDLGDKEFNCERKDYKKYDKPFVFIMEDFAVSIINGKVVLDKYTGDNTMVGVEVPSGIEVIGANAFGGKAAHIKLPNTVTEIADNAFTYDSYIKNINIPNSVVRIGRGAFAYTNIESIVIPDSVKTIGIEAFYNCTKLKDVTVPSSLFIDKSVFYNTGWYKTHKG